MKPDDTTIQQAIADLVTIRRAIERTSGQPQSGAQAYAAVGANLILQVSALVLSGVLIAVELICGNLISRQIISSAGHANLKMLGITEVGMALLLLVYILYLILKRSAKSANVDFSGFIARNFVYLKNLSFFSDLVVKYTFFVLLILAEKPEWVAPVFLLFIADYLVQGRFFTLPLRMALGLGGAVMLLAALQFQLGSIELLWPLLVFAVVSLLSILELVKINSVSQQQKEVSE